MKFNFVGKNLRLDDDLKAYAEKKVGKMDKFFRQESSANVVFSVEHGRCRAEVTLTNNGMIYRASELTGGMHASIDSACALIERQIRKNKTKLEKKLREGALEREIVPEYIPAEEFEEDEKKFDIVRTKRFSLKPMSPQEAVLQMNLLGHEFFAFRNMDAEDGFSIVYKRRQGGYGLIVADDAK